MGTSAQSIEAEGGAGEHQDWAFGTLKRQVLSIHHSTQYSQQPEGGSAGFTPCHKGRNREVRLLAQGHPAGRPGDQAFMILPPLCLGSFWPRALGCPSPGEGTPEPCPAGTLSQFIGLQMELPGLSPETFSHPPREERLRCERDLLCDLRHAACPIGASVCGAGGWGGSLS